MNFDQTAQISAEMLASIAGVVISLAASYLPGFSAWYSRLDGSRKRLLMLGLLAASALAVLRARMRGMAEPLTLGLSCDLAGALALVRAFLTALVSNQATFAISPKRANERTGRKLPGADRGDAGAGADE